MNANIVKNRNIIAFVTMIIPRPNGCIQIAIVRS